MSNELFNFYYDPARQGYDTTLWKTLSGTPGIVSSDLDLNAAGILYYGDIKDGDFTFDLVVPTVPSPGDTRIWGLAQANSQIAIAFMISGVDFNAVIMNEDGSTCTKLITTFEPGWAAAPIKYKISWKGSYVYFYVDGVLKAEFNDGDVDDSDPLVKVTIPKVALSPTVINGVSDDLLIKDIQFQHIKTYI